MAEAKTTKLEREYVVPLRRKWILLPKYRRAGRAAKAVKEFIAKHMKVADRDVDNVKLDIYLNNELWFRGRRNPPSRIKVKAVKEEDIVHVSLAEMPQIVKFAKAKHEKRHKKAEEKPKAEVKEAKPEEAKTSEEKKEKVEEKKVEVEKEKSVEQEKLKEAKQEKRAEKHVAKGKAPEIHRRSMSRH